MKTFFRVLCRVIFWVLIIITLFQGASPIYDFPQSKPFSGAQLYNPYQTIDSLGFAQDFKKTNIHAHESRKGMPFEYMHDYKEGEFAAIYKDAGYEYALVSDHQYINPISPVEAYEHGINLNNFHINSYGTDDVWWFDFPLMFRKESQMQWQIDKLRKRDATMISINHPYRWRWGLGEDKIVNLRGYDVVEVARGGERAWDNALSAGNYVMLSATDDSHFPDSINATLQIRYSMTAAKNASELVGAIKDGKSYGVELMRGKSPRGAGTEPKFHSVKLFGDTLSIKSPERVDSIVFVGQGGEVMQRGTGAEYIFKESDTYIRATLYLSNGMVVWLNPVARISALQWVEPAVVNWWKTVLNWVAVFVIALLLYIIMRKTTRRKRRITSNHYKRAAYRASRRGQYVNY